MQCIRPIKASLASDGTITFRQKNAIPGLVPFQIPCRKCLPCRLNIASEKAIRAMHEAQIFGDNNCFLTLTYSDAHLSSPRLHLEDFQTFMKDLRNHVGHAPESRIGVMYTGEYGEETKRPHWHAILFNYDPPDKKKFRTTERGDHVFKSTLIDEIWGKNDPEKKPSEIGNVTMDSAGYVARYAAKKLVHGKDQEHDFHPIHKTSSKNAIGKRWIEKYWEQTFNNGYVLHPQNKSKLSIPRYYVDWLRKQIPSEYVRYVTGLREKTIKLAEENARKEELIHLSNMLNHEAWKTNSYPLTRPQVKERVLQSKFKKLQENLKL